MKKKIYSVILCGMLLCVPVVFFSCDDDVDFDEEAYCHDQGELYCGDDRKSGCCAQNVPWTDGHGSCYNTLSYCRETGWSCTSCY